MGNANVLDKTEPVVKDWRLSSQSVLPQNITSRKRTDTGYDIYPYHTLGEGKIFKGYESLVNWIVGQKNVRIDGYIGIFWDDVQDLLDYELQERGLSVKWTYLADYMKSSTEIQGLVEPFLGEEKSVWGKRCTLDITDFFHADLISGVLPNNSCDINIAIGIGAALLKWDAPIIYLELPKNEIQYRSRAGAISNFGNGKSEGASEMYKRSYFVDWVVLNAHKKKILNDITILADAQWKDSINWMFNADLQKGLTGLSRSLFRVRPWFEAGAWGGHWMQQRIEGLSEEEVNYAWSFELIAPENGIVFESDGNLLEVCFDFLMFKEHKAILGKHADTFGTEFPIRFDFLDTFDGGNLSIQCHPSLGYIRKEFGENITQDETYYILDCKSGAQVFLGFQEDIDRTEFEKALEDSQQFSEAINVEKYIQTHHAKKHDLFLIPNGTVHSAGADNLVLEISATPYIFTFKMYDWMRMGLDGHPRPINIDHAFKNLNFERKGKRVKNELISVASVIEKGSDWELIHLPTHEEHFYDIHRIEFESQVKIDTNDVCHILMLVEGTSIAITTADETAADFHYAETIVIPAAAKSYRIVNTGSGRAKVVKAFVKENISFR